MKLLMICTQVCFIPKSFLFFLHRNLCLVKLEGEHTNSWMRCSGQGTRLHSQSIQLFGVSLDVRSLLFLCPLHSICVCTVQILQNVLPFVEILRISTPKLYLIVDGLTA